MSPQNLQISGFFYFKIDKLPTLPKLFCLESEDQEIKLVRPKALIFRISDKKCYIFLLYITWTVLVFHHIFYFNVKIFHGIHSHFHEINFSLYPKKWIICPKFYSKGIDFFFKFYNKSNDKYKIKFSLVLNFDFSF